MESNWWTTFPWGWLIAVIVLYLVGVFEGRATGYRKRKKEEEKEKERQAHPQPQTVTQTVTETVTVDDPGLLRIKSDSGGFALDLDGTRVNPISLSPEQRKRLVEILNIMRPWLAGPTAPSPASPPATPVASTPVPPAAPSGRPSPLLDRIQSRAAQSAPPAQSPPAPAAGQSALVPQPVSPPPPPSPQPAASKPATIAKDDRPAAPAGSMVNQIDSILQARLVGTPLEERGIFLAQSPEGGVSVYIGITRYGGIDDVPEPEIKAAIRAAIAEWEEKFTPGLKR